MRLAIDWLRYQDRARFIDFVLFRLQHGQCCLSNMSFEFLEKQLTAHGVLKQVVDGVVRHNILDRCSPRSDLLTLCAVVYGSNFELTADVLYYCRQLADLEERHSALYAADALTRLRSLRDASWLRHRTDLDTGFHRFDKATLRWERVEKTWT
jgi:hypothetical protein